jgi:ABC-type uncharacterized transport system substrate-binding protein
MRRREFITLLGGAAVSWPLPARAQQTGMPVIGILGFENPVFVAGFRHGLAEAGYVPGQNVAIELHWGNRFSFPRLAAELVERKVDVIVTTASLFAILEAKNATSRIPIVFSIMEDPVKYGLVSSLSRPGGNVTGMTFLAGELVGKRLNLLLEVIPRATTIAHLWLPDTPISEQQKSETLAAGRALGREIIISEVRRFDFEAAFTTLIAQRASALMVGNFASFLRDSGKIVELVARHKIVAMYPNRRYVVNGGLMSYGTAATPSRELALNYIVPILKGAKPADLPVQQPTQFGLVINLKTAKELGLTLPRTLLAAATELID